MAGFNIEEAEQALAQEHESKELKAAISEIVALRKELESVRNECSSLKDGVSTLNNDLADKVDKLRKASQIIVTPEVKTYVQGQGEAISKRLCHDLESKGRSIVNRMTSQTDRVVMPTCACYVLCLSLVILLTGFISLAALNVYRIHSDFLTQFLWTFGGAMIGFDVIIVLFFVWLRLRD